MISVIELTLTPGVSSVDLAWGQEGGVAEGWLVRYRPVGGEWTTLALPAEPLSVTILELEPSTEYEVEVEALGGEGALEATTSTGRVWVVLPWESNTGHDTGVTGWKPGV